MGESRTIVAAVRQQYERWPYPHYPLLAKVAPLTVWQLNASYLAARAGVADPGTAPRIWIAGCGTFQPHVFATANPGARILATDLSARSLQLAERRCALRGQRVRFQQVDLSDAANLPDGPFDLIECYGVLMCLPDPLATLRALAARLSPSGVLRLMVYPHFSRRRVFQLQRVAQLLGLHHDDPTHPRLLRALVQALPRAHPLRYAFATYADARNDQGLADAFLHPFDRGFTGLELGALVAQAGLAPGFFFHRPWAEPASMAERLGFGAVDPFATLHYLDLWQELRGNFVVCLRRADAPRVDGSARVHPLLDWRGAGLSWPHRVRLALAQAAGIRLRDKLAGCYLRIPARDLRARAGATLLPSAPCYPAGTTAAPALDEVRVWAGARAPNPFYAHLIAAWRAQHIAGLPELGPLARELARWQADGDPLEDEDCPFGLTPLGTARVAPDAVAQALVLAEQPASRWDEVVFGDAPVAQRALADVLARAGLSARLPEPAAARRELHNLLCTPRALTVGGDG